MKKRFSSVCTKFSDCRNKVCDILHHNRKKKKMLKSQNQSGKALHNNSNDLAFDCSESADFGTIKTPPEESLGKTALLGPLHAPIFGRHPDSIIPQQTTGDDNEIDTTTRKAAEHSSPSGKKVVELLEKEKVAAQQDDDEDDDDDDESIGSTDDDEDENTSSSLKKQKKPSTKNIRKAKLLRDNPHDLAFARLLMSE
jgi:hypothetical protein